MESSYGECIDSIEQDLLERGLHPDRALGGDRDYRRSGQSGATGVLKGEGKRLRGALPH